MYLLLRNTIRLDLTITQITCIHLAFYYINVQNFKLDNRLQRMNPAVSTIWDIGIAVGPVTGYVYQFFLIKKRKSVGTFSINLCGMLLFCNILRIGFYFFNRYAIPLLVQSILMILAQILLLYICVKSMNLEGVFDKNAEEEEDFILKDFWRWKHFSKYVIAIAVFTGSVIVISYFFYKVEANAVGELIGYLSLISESLLMVPQILENYKQKRVKGLSHFLVFLNFIGDLMKFGYFIVNNQPVQFFVCGVIQIIMDFVVILQICYYGRLNKGQQNGQNNENVENGGSQKGDEKGVVENIEIQMNMEEAKPPTNYKELEEQNGQTVQYDIN